MNRAWCRVCPFAALAVLLGFVAADPPCSSAIHARGGHVSVVGGDGQRKSFLGYEVGEESRYVLGPPEVLPEGAVGTWSILLEDIFAPGGMPEGVFALRHEWRRFLEGDLPRRMITSVVSEGWVRVNARGFPLQTRIETVRHLAGLGDEAYTVKYTFDGDGYRKQVSDPLGTWERDVPVRDHRHLDHGEPSGLYPFLPKPPGCFDSRTANPYGGARVPKPTKGATDPRPRVPDLSGRVADNSACAEWLFANPGLLSLALPMLREATTGQREFLFFTPAGPLGEPGTDVRLSVPWVRARSTGYSATEKEMQAAERPSTYSRVETLYLREHGRIQVGSRWIDAQRLEGVGDYASFWIDDKGRVVRADLEVPEGTPAVWIRILFASEF